MFIIEVYDARNRKIACKVPRDSLRGSPTTEQEAEL